MNKKGINEVEFKNELVKTRGLMFAMQMKPENDWHHIGGGVKLGDAASVVCYWKPTGALNYRVVYGDLSVRDATEAEVSALSVKSHSAGK